MMIKFVLTFGAYMSKKMVYNRKYHLQAYLDNWAYKNVHKQMTDYLDENLFED